VEARYSVPPTLIVADADTVERMLPDAVNDAPAAMVATGV